MAMATQASLSTPTTLISSSSSTSTTRTLATPWKLFNSSPKPISLRTTRVSAEQKTTEKEAPVGFVPPELDPNTPSPIFGGSTGGLLRKAQVEEFYVITFRILSLMEDLKRMDVEKSLSNDMLHVLKNGKDIDDVSLTYESSKSLLSHCEAECLLTRRELEEYEKKIEAVKKMIRELEEETVTDDDERELEEELQVERSLQHELREIEDKHASWQELAVSVDKHNTDFQRKQRDALRSSDLLSMCASVTNIIPDFDDKSRISGYILNESKSKCERFDLEPSISPVEICNKLWKM